MIAQMSSNAQACVRRKLVSARDLLAISTAENNGSVSPAFSWRGIKEDLSAAAYRSFPLDPRHGPITQLVNKSPASLGRDLIYLLTGPARAIISPGE